MLDRETTIQQKPAALRAVNKVISSNKHLSAKSQYKVRSAIGAVRLDTFLRASSPARGKINFLRELCASSDVSGRSSQSEDRSGW